MLAELPIVASDAPPDDAKWSGGACDTIVSPRLPRWLKKSLPPGGGLQFTARLIEELRLETVCESAKCPNRMECWSQKTATFMILGNVCTRPCGFCSVPKGKTEALEARRAGARGRSGRAAGTQARRDHLGDARRPAGRRRGAFLSLRAGRARANRRGGRSADARLHRQAGGGRARRRGRARSLQPQHRNRAAAVSRQSAGARATTAGRWTCCGA